MIHTIKNLVAEEILDSRGNPTVEVTAELTGGVTGTASVPSGASTGQYEAWELRDEDPNRYNGKGVLKACGNVREKILPALQGIDVKKQQEIDRRMRELDGTPNKASLGANAILAVSLACARAGAAATRTPLYRYLRAVYALTDTDFLLPEPMLNVINGGKHADNGLDFQEYMIVPHAETFAERMRIGAEIAMNLGGLLRSKGMSTLVGDEGGFAPRCTGNRDPFNLISGAVDRTHYRLGDQVTLALDAAASEFYKPDQQRYLLSLEHTLLTNDDLLARYKELLAQFPFTSIEDGLDEDDWEGWVRMTKELGTATRVIGDDLFVTNVERFQKGITMGAANAILVKPNQIGTLTETMDAIRLAREHDYSVVISHRSGDTSDPFIADLTVAVNAPYIKAGAVSRGERLAKYNRLLEIEHELQ